ncbi:hypothetical protein RHO12_11560 [Orbus sturtevantii]|uniref:hypothetical protein n=1 Tax=Orbus sturtevantii TaxID=3074109 RepID=UPI00370D7222
MIRKFLKVFSLILAIVIFSNAYAVTKVNQLKLSTIDVDYSSSDIDSDGEEIKYTNFYDKNVMLHPPILVEYNNKKSVLFFFPPAKGGRDQQGLILNYNLGNNKMNVVGFVHGINEQIQSVFGYQYNNDDATILVLTKNNVDNQITYSTFTNSIIEENGGLYIKQFKDDEINIQPLSNCIDGGTDYLGNKQVCKYKDAASIKKFFDDMNRQNE